MVHIFLEKERWPVSCLLIGCADSEFCICILSQQSGTSGLRLTALRIIADICEPQSSCYMISFILLLFCIFKMQLYFMVIKFFPYSLIVNVLESEVHDYSV
jgi:hypothetical protein